MNRRCGPVHNNLKNLGAEGTQREEVVRWVGLLFIFLGLTCLIFLFDCGTGSAAEQKSIEIIRPASGAVYEEGEICPIEWAAKGVERVSIAVAVGGKDRGLLEFSDGEYALDARKGLWEWTIPIGFVTSYGLKESHNVRVMVFDADDPKTSVVSDYFTIKGEGKNSEKVTKTDDDFMQAIQSYYDLIGEGKYREAFELIFPEKLTLSFADGSSVSFGTRQDYYQWLNEIKNIKSINLVDLKEVPVPDRELAMLGIRCFQVTLKADYKDKRQSLGFSGAATYFIYLVKGSDGKVRILSIGTGP
jgi:hypothetical protein